MISSCTGSLVLFLGNMYSGKSSRLILEYQRWKAIKKRTLVINHCFDDRYGSADVLSSHDHMKVPCISVRLLSDVPEEQVENAEAIFINEGQFFNDLKSKCLEWCELKGKHIFVAGLDGDRHRKVFGQILDLIPFADYYEKLLAKCIYCLDGTNACFTHDTLKNKTVGQIQVGAEQYVPLCRKHYLKENGDYRSIDSSVE